jgi:hypothetical protein
LSAVSLGDLYDLFMSTCTLGGTGRLKGGRHMKYAPHTPMSNLYVSVLNKFGIRQEKFGDSMGALEI